jgi:hypothetical protein
VGEGPLGLASGFQVAGDRVPGSAGG